EYFNRFMQLVQWTDEKHGDQRKTVKEYLEITNLEEYFDHLGKTPLSNKAGQVSAVSKAWLDTVKQSLNSLVACFVVPGMEEQAKLVYKKRFDTARSKAGQTAQDLAVPKHKGDIYVPDASRPEGGYWVKKPQATLETMLAHVSLHEEKVQRLEYDLAKLTHGNKKVEKDKVEAVKLALAKRKQQLLAGYLLLWTCERTSDLRKLVVNWDIAAYK
ncbi:unnamed protein product, partial [Prorocentrum cordatum]